VLLSLLLHAPNKSIIHVYVLYLLRSPPPPIQYNHRVQVPRTRNVPVYHYRNAHVYVYTRPGVIFYRRTFLNFFFFFFSSFLLFLLFHFIFFAFSFGPARALLFAPSPVFETLTVIVPPRASLYAHARYIVSLYAYCTRALRVRARQIISSYLSSWKIRRTPRGRALVSSSVRGAVLAILVYKTLFDLSSTPRVQRLFGTTIFSSRRAAITGVRIVYGARRGR
jgi:hypothetical protein